MKKIILMAAVFVIALFAAQNANGQEVVTSISGTTPDKNVNVIKNNIPPDINNYNIPNNPKKGIKVHDKFEPLSRNDYETLGSNSVGIYAGLNPKDYPNLNPNTLDFYSAADAKDANASYANKKLGFSLLIGLIVFLIISVLVILYRKSHAVNWVNKNKAI
jgi:hypothetical protein